MELIEHNGEKYQVLSWKKPEDTEYEIGDMCFGVYAAMYGDGPYVIVSMGDGTFKPAYFSFENGDPQPLFVMDMPGIRGKGLLKINENEAD